MSVLGRCNRCKGKAALRYVSKTLGRPEKAWCIECLEREYPDAVAELPAAMRAAQKFLDAKNRN